MKRCIAIIVFGSLLIACRNDDIATATADEQIQLWLDSTGVIATREENSGIYYYADSLNPTGTQAATGRVAAIYYILSDLEGNIIASHQRVDGDSLLFKIGASAIYPIGIDGGISLMREGEIYNFILPPDQAYTDLSSGAINPNLIAHLQIHLTAVHDEPTLFAQEQMDIQQYIDDNFLDSLAINPSDSTEHFPSGIAYKRRSVGVGPLPSPGDTIIVDYTGRFIDDTAFGSDTDFQWFFQSGEPRDILSGFEFGVSLMQTGEEALIMIPSSQGYQESALIIPDFIDADLVEDNIIPDYVLRIAPYQTLLFEITRLD
ncbi:FKBP-type peptidyl-prolyl cis-trans isomerase [Ekhidna lutea]|uniref:FKBP-type peptidyl-prolyl cis-trans isomerase n=1 Tax=Ekhidna lutea TaxID=447679 RepID=UPI00117E5E2D|nr:FKBP-type peptidyl-prolyl cis-trans isomerase [Ekhidna lutea]